METGIKKPGEEGGDKAIFISLLAQRSFHIFSLHTPRREDLCYYLYSQLSLIITAMCLFILLTRMIFPIGRDGGGGRQEGRVVERELGEDGGRVNVSRL